MTISNNPIKQNDQLCQCRLTLLGRRAILKSVSCGVGWLAFCDLANRTPASESSVLEKKSHFAAKTKRVIFLCIRGGPSHVDTFDYKPQLIKDDGKPGRRNGTKLLASPWEFKQYGESGLWMSDLLPQLSKHADRLSVIRSMQTDIPAHPQAFLKLHTGPTRFVRPSIGAWTLYGLGSENEELPGFVTITPPSGFGARKITALVSYRRFTRAHELVLTIGRWLVQRFPTWHVDSKKKVSEKNLI